MDRWRELTKLKWVKYPDVPPTENGYYYTHYFNKDFNTEAFKCILWSNTKGWCGWHQDGGPKMTIYEYAPSTREDFYMMCVEHQREDEKNG
jgi:hypothetical protein